ncbi:MAG: DUF6261 family protein [Prevotellaceae bacterium]|jgi:hypothetical protein|nr:DUF6261 family protein [Prevotellaceae bacterium]
MNEVILRINLNGLKNETHVQFNEGIDSVFVKYSPQTLGIQPLYLHYRDAFNNELDALDYIGRSELTAKIVAQDRKRDSIYRGFVDSVKGAGNHFEPAHREAANLVLNIFSHYGNIARKTLDDETAAINDLVRELNLPVPAQAVSLLGANVWLNKLVEENNIFTELMKERYSETAGKTSFRMKAMRVETDKYWHAMVSQIENQILAGTVINENFIRELNAVIERFKHILAQEIGDSGLMIFSSGNIPDGLDIRLWMIESDEDVRSFAFEADKVLGSDAFKDLYAAVETALAVTNPVLAGLIAVGWVAVSLLRQKLRANKDDLAGYWQATLNRAEHYPHGPRDKQDVYDTTGTILVDYTLFGFEKELKTKSFAMQSKSHSSDNFRIQNPVIFRVGRFCALSILCISVKLRKELNQTTSLNSFFSSSPQGIELLRSSDGTWTVYPVQAERSSGYSIHSPQLRKELNQTASLNSFFPSSSQGIELLRSSDRTWTVYPELRFACTGLSKLDAYGVKRHEASLHFYITILARTQYKSCLAGSFICAQIPQVDDLRLRKSGFSSRVCPKSPSHRHCERILQKTGKCRERHTSIWMASMKGSSKAMIFSKVLLFSDREE